MTEEEIKAKRREILEWERDNRTLKNRAHSGHSCYYYLEGTPGCAVGRLISEDLAKLLNNRGTANGIFDKLPIDVQELGKDFLWAIQQFHDTATNFNDDGLVDAGKTAMAALLEKWT